MYPLLEVLLRDNRQCAALRHLPAGVCTLPGGSKRILSTVDLIGACIDVVGLRLMIVQCLLTVVLVAVVSGN